jgi:hypothetical protein
MGHFCSLTVSRGSELGNWEQGIQQPCIIQILLKFTLVLVFESDNQPKCYRFWSVKMFVIMHHYLEGTALFVFIENGCINQLTDELGSVVFWNLIEIQTHHCLKAITCYVEILMLMHQWSKKFHTSLELVFDILSTDATTNWNVEEDLLLKDEVLIVLFLPTDAYTSAIAFNVALTDQ